MVAFALIARTYLIPKPRNELRGSQVELLFGGQTSDLKPSFFAILLCDDDPAMVMVLVFAEKFFKRGGVNRQFCTDIVCPQVLNHFDAHWVQYSCIKTGDKYVTLLE